MGVLFRVKRLPIQKKLASLIINDKGHFHTPELVFPVVVDDNRFTGINGTRSRENYNQPKFVSKHGLHIRAVSRLACGLSYCPNMQQAYDFNFNFLLQKDVNEMNKPKHGMVRDEVIMNNRLKWS